jgi:hypothetical protein
MHFLQRLYYCCSSTVKFTAVQFLTLPSPHLLWGLLRKGEAGQLALHLCPTHQQWECCLRWSKSHSNHHHDCLSRSQSLLLHLLVKQSPTWPTSLRAVDPCEEQRDPWSVLVDMSWACVNFLTFSRQSFSGDISVRSLCIEVSLIHCCRFALLGLL